MENQKLLLFQELKLRRETMVKMIWKEPKDDLIFKTGFIILTKTKL